MMRKEQCLWKSVVLCDPMRMKNLSYQVRKQTVEWKHVPRHMVQHDCFFFSSQLCHALMCVVSPFAPHGQFSEAGPAWVGESPIYFPGMRGYLSNSRIKNQGAGGSDHISKSTSPKTLWFCISSA